MRRILGFVMAAACLTVAACAGEPTKPVASGTATGTSTVVAGGSATPSGSASASASSSTALVSGAALGPPCNADTFVGYDKMFVNIVFAVPDDLNAPWITSPQFLRGDGFVVRIFQDFALRWQYLVDEINWKRLPQSTFIGAGPKAWDIAIPTVPVQDSWTKTNDVTHPLLKLPQAVLVRGDGAVKPGSLVDTANLKLGLVTGSTGEQAVTSAIRPINAPTTFSGIGEALVALQGGRIDAIVTSLSEAVSLAGQPGSPYKVAGHLKLDATPKPDTMAIVLVKDALFTNCANKVVDNMVADGTLKAAYDQYLAPAAGPELG